MAQSRPLGATAFVDEASMRVRDNGPNRRLQGRHWSQYVGIIAGFSSCFPLLTPSLTRSRKGEGGETNWVPTDRNRRFELMFRFYGPIKELSTKRGRCRMPPASGADTKFRGLFMIINNSRHRF